jgi:Raf kinase inhibitor-like YbhB/YbcL family protein
MALMIKSPVFQNGDAMPLKYTCKGENISPPLFWEGPPDNTASFALICEDPDAPSGMFSHWVIYNILKGTVNLPQGVPTYDITENGAMQGVNDAGETGYYGPCPPPGAAHRYFFKLYALDKILEVESGLTREQLLKAMEGHIIGEADIMVKFKR